MMSAEGIGITLGFATLFITLIGLGVSGGIAYGTLKTTVMKTDTKLDRMEQENLAGHAKLFDCQKDTDVKLGKVEEHLRSINGSMKQHTEQIEALEKDSHSRGE